MVKEIKDEVLGVSTYVSSDEQVAEELVRRVESLKGLGVDVAASVGPDIAKPVLESVKIKLASLGVTLTQREMAGTNAKVERKI